MPCLSVCDGNSGTEKWRTTSDDTYPTTMCVCMVLGRTGGGMLDATAIYATRRQEEERGNERDGKGKAVILMKQVEALLQL